jgi:Leucine-rich repeat (LRR) protein
MSRNERSSQKGGVWDRPASSRSSDIEAFLSHPGAAHMVHLDLSSCSLTSLSAYCNQLAVLSNLKHLNISKNMITSLRTIRELPMLETITCSKNNLKVLDGLEECPQLNTIIADDNMISMLDDLRFLSKLRTLSLRGNTLSSIAALPHHLPAALNSLDVANNELGNLSDLRYVSSLMELRRLDLRANPLTSMSHMLV